MAIVCNMGGVLRFAGIVFPKYIIDELTGAHDISRIVFFVWLFQARCKMGQVRIYTVWAMDLVRRLHEAALERLEASSFLDLQSRAYKFLEADVYGFGVVLGKTADIVGRLFPSPASFPLFRFLTLKHIEIPQEPLYAVWHPIVRHSVVCVLCVALHCPA